MAAKGGHIDFMFLAHSLTWLLDPLLLISHGDAYVTLQSKWYFESSGHFWKVAKK